MDRAHLKSLIHSPFFGNENVVMAVLATMVGLAAGYGAIGFRWLIEFFQGVSYGDKGDLLELALSLPWYQRLLIPALGGLVVGPLVYFFAREAKGHGVPEVMEAVALRRGIIRKRVVIVKTLASALTIGTGGSVGREGPIVQIGSAIGSTFGQMLRLSGERTKTLVGCGAAAGIAATFNAPIAGTMFALEIILGDFGLATFSPIVISSVVSTAVSRHYLGNYPAFQVPSYQLISAWELVLYMVLGLFCAVIAVVFTKTVYGFEDFFSRIRIPEYLKATLGGLVLGMIAIWFPHVLGVGYPAIDLALMGKLSWWFLFLLILVKILATSITLGGGGSGGIFAPSLFLGAMAGGFFGMVVNEYLPGVTASAGAYSIVGMAALVSGTTHGPLGAILILFEMTGNYRIILPLMIACIISSVLSGQLLKESIYTMKLIRRGVDIRAGKEVNVLKSIPVKEAMKNDVETVPETMSLGKLAEKIATSKYNSFPVVNAGGKLVGVLSYLDYHDVLFDPELHNLVVAGELATRSVVTVAEEDSLFTALGRITSKDFSILPVVGRDDPLLIRGVVTRRDIMSAYNSAVTKKDVLSG